ncbi:MAG TPA: protein kinase [Thermoanaerobaculia bacterium]
MEECLGEGALGVVHRAVHIGLEKAFAVKLLKTAGASTPAALARFRTEALALGRLRHPHIVEVTDSGIDDSTGAPYLVMEHLEGVPLSELCRARGPLPLPRALAILEEIAGAVDAAHRAGILHRDLKPGNVLVCAGGVKVLDFGLAELGGHEPSSPGAPAGSPSLTATGALPGTPLYVAPELIRHGEASPASDVYSFAVIAYELLGGGPPFQGTVAEVLASHLEAEPPPLPLPPEVWQALRKVLRKDPALRPRTAGEVVRNLRESVAQAERTHWKAVEFPRRLRMAALLTAALLAVGLLLPWPPVPAAERGIHDLRVRTSPGQAPDPRILLVTFDEASLDSSSLSLADRADEIGRTLSRVFAAGARGVAVAILPPETEEWSASPAFSDLLLRHSEDLTLAVFSKPDGKLLGTKCLDALTVAALGPRRVSDMFGFVNLDEDRDGVIRRGRRWFLDRAGRERPSWAARAARELGVDRGTPREYWIDTRIDWRHYARVSWREVPTALDRNPDLFRDRLVLVGGDFQGSGDDYHHIPQRFGRNTVSVLTLQALMVDTIARGLPIREPGRTPVLTVAALGVFLATAGALCTRQAGAVWIALGSVLYLALSFPVFWWTGLMLPVTAPLLLVLLGYLAALGLRRRLPSPPEVSTS